VDDKIDKLIHEYKLYYCVECGKCVAACPMNVIYDDFSYGFSSRGIIRKVILEQEAVDGEDIWNCLNCNLCADVCPAGVKFSEFVSEARKIAIAEGHTENAAHCERCGCFYLSVRTVAAYKHVLDKNHRPDEYANLCPNCKVALCAEHMKMDVFRVGK
jgi:heterodisulfide reductase subunit C